MMKKLFLKLIVAALAVATLCCLASCSKWGTPFGDLDDEGYDISVRFDVGGGMFAGTSDVYVIDVFDYEDFTENEDGMYEIPLLTPDDKSRGDYAFEVSRTKYFLAGWYTERTPRTNDAGEPLDDFGVLTSVSGRPQGYTYKNKWDFENDRFLADPSKDYTTEDYSLTLYAAWIPYFSFEFYADGADTPYATVEAKSLTVPKLDEWVSGVLDMENFPDIKGKTLTGAYLDETHNTPLTVDTLTGIVDYETGINATPVTKIYTTWRDGTWCKVKDASDLTTNFAANGCYELYDDLDFSGSTAFWPFANTNFSGTILGNGHTIKNVTVQQTNFKQIYGGLFATVQASAVFEDITFENITYCLNTGSGMTGAAFGLFAGQIAQGATFDNVSISGTLSVGANVYLSESVTYGLLSGNGTPSSLSHANIVCVADDTNGTALIVTVNTETGYFTISQPSES